ncbi:MAG: hypothetical protein AABX33_00865 [Nanoarchaeota archaeon]
MKKIFLISLFFVFLINSCSKQQIQKTQNSVTPALPNDISALTPEQVVVLYFKSWNIKKYDIMYSLISDGFKKIEPTAITFDDFQLYMSSFFETGSGINVVEAREEYQNEKGAGVKYKIKIIEKDGTKKEFINAYTLKKKSDRWKLIHPYGEHIDES